MEEIFYIVFGLAVVLLIASGPCSSAIFRTTMYNMQISHCDKSLYVNNSKWFLGDYYFVPSIGVCPKQHTKMKTTRNSKGRKTKTLIYRDCINFHLDSETWKEIDEGNRANGYSSDMEGGSKKWHTSKNLLIPACVLSYALYAMTVCVFNCGDGDVSIFGLGLITVPASFALFVAAILMISKTDQLDEKAWETYYFSTCSVKIFQSTSYALLVFCILCTGIPSLALAIGCCVLFKDEAYSFTPTNFTMINHTQETNDKNDASIDPTVAQVVTVPYANVRTIHSAVRESGKQLVRQLSSKSSESTLPRVGTTAVPPGALQFNQEQGSVN